MLNVLTTYRSGHMRYFLKKTKIKKGIYLQIYEAHYIPGKGTRNSCYKSIGYLDDLIKGGQLDPISDIKREINSLNDSIDESKEQQIGNASSKKNLGYFLVKAMIDKLDVDETMNLMTSNRQFRFDTSDFVRAMIYAQIVNPGSKLSAFENVIPSLYDCPTFSYQQMLDGIEYIGEDYQKYIELYNHQIDLVYPRDTSVAFFDCTNYYFEIDLPKEDKQKGPSKENFKGPIISQALLLDANQIPIGMEMFPGNESEKPYIRKSIESIKDRFDISSRIVQVADKGLNCARNIYAAVKEAHDGYIFSKSTHGKNLDEMEKKWVLLDNEGNIWHDVKDSDGTLVYKYKETIDTFSYHCYLSKDDERESVFSVKEKRIVTYNPSLAKKQRAEIEKQVEKAKTTMNIKQVSREDYGDSVKYVNFEAKDKEGRKIKIDPKLNQDKINEDLSYAGYNLLVTSEIKKSATEIYSIYHGLWRIEECFRIMKSYLEARPVFLQKQESIYGHFLICYLSLTIIRLLELKVFKDEITVDKLISFMRKYEMTSGRDGTYINNASVSKTYTKIKEVLGLSKLGNLYPRKKDLDNLLKTEI